MDGWMENDVYKHVEKCSYFCIDESEQYEVGDCVERVMS